MKGWQSCANCSQFSFSGLLSERYALIVASGRLALDDYANLAIIRFSARFAMAGNDLKTCSRVAVKLMYIFVRTVGCGPGEIGPGPDGTGPGPGSIGPGPGSGCGGGRRPWPFFDQSSNHQLDNTFLPVYIVQYKGC